MSNVIAIVQARMGSTRLPGKVLMDIAGQTALERVVRRVRRFRGVDEVVVATSVAREDDAVAAKSDRLGVACHRGSDADVLERFRETALRFAADVCVRVTADCPLIDPDVSSDIIARFRAAVPAVDYASNKIPQSFPRGLDTEVFTRAALERAAARATQPYERSHVTIYMYEHPDEFRLLSITSDVDLADWRWTVDTPEDLSFVREVYDRLGPGNDFTWLDVVALLRREPHLRSINGHVNQKPVRSG